MRKIKGLISIIVASAIFLSGCGTKLYTEGTDSGYTLIKEVDGVSFGIASAVIRNATAITNISESMEFEKDQTYLYKNGESEYFLFNINSLVLAVEKDSKFGIKDAPDKAEAITSSPLLGIWFNIPKSKLEYTDNTADSVYKLMATVNAEVSVTSEIYNDFSGKLVIIDDGASEYSMFVGSAGNDFGKFDKDIQEAISYMAASLQKAAPEVPQAGPAVALGGEDPSSEEASSTEVSAEPAQEVADTADTGSSVAETAAEESTEAASEEISAESSAPSEDEVVVEDEVVIEDETGEANEDGEKPEEQKEEPSEETPSEPEKETDSEIDESIVDTIVSAPQRGDSIVLDNQKNTHKDDDTVYESSIYDMLRQRNWGYLSVKSGSSTETLSARIMDLKTGDDARALIKNATDNGTVPYKYFEAPAGTTWHLVKLERAQGGNTALYIDVKLVGADGKNLNFRGIKYPERTYEIKVSDTEMYVYYAVPNGCPEYVLECGDGTVDSSKLKSSYYLMKKGTDY